MPRQRTLSNEELRDLLEPYLTPGVERLPLYEIECKKAQERQIDLGRLHGGDPSSKLDEGVGLVR